MKKQLRYFRITDDMRIRGRWHIKSPVDDEGVEVIPWRLIQGIPVKADTPWRIALTHQGHELDFSLTDINTAVVSQDFVDVFSRLSIQDEAQFVPARIDGYSEPYFVLNPLHVVKCIDEARCEEVSFWEPRHGEPELVGQYRHVWGLKIDPTSVGNLSIFRPWGWPIAIIVSEAVKQAMEEEDLVGPVFTEV